MVGGTIKSFTIIQKHPGNYLVKFVVSDTNSKDECRVKAFIPRPAFKGIDVGASIWWQADKLIINIFGVGDNEFRKVGNSF